MEKMKWKHVYAYLETVHDLQTFIEQFQESGRKQLGYDVETTSLRWWDEKDRVVGIGLGYVVGETIHTGYCNSIHPHEAFQVIKPVLEDPLVAKIGANIKFDAHWAARYGVIVMALHDVQVMARILRTQYFKVGLDVLIEKEFKAVHQEYHDLLAHAKEKKIRYLKSQQDDGVMAQMDPRLVGKYCAADVYWTLRLALRYLSELRQNPVIFSLYKVVEQPLIQCCLDMETQGIRVDRGLLQEMQIDLASQIELTERKTYDIAGKAFNMSSSKEIAQLLRSVGIAPEQRRRKKGEEITFSESYDKRVLNKHRDHPLVACMLRYRTLSYLASTYVDSMLSYNLDVLHTSIRQEAARTGRMGASQPNLMGIPHVDEEDEVRKEFSIRKIVLPLASDSVLVCIDLCLAKGTKVVTEFGIKPIEWVVEHKPGVLSCVGGETLRFNKVTASAVIPEADVYEVEMEDGTKVKCTRDHKWMAYDGSELRTFQLEPGTRMAHVKHEWHGRKRNYPVWWIRSNRNYFKIHSLMAEFKYGLRPKGYHVDHIDGNPRNWHPSNIRYLPASENLSHGAGRWWNRATPAQRERKTASLVYGVKHNRIKYNGMSNPNCILTEAQVSEIRSIHKKYAKVGPGSTGNLARQYGVKCVTISKIVNGSIWKHTFSNHRVKSVRYVGKEPVYQITVDRDHAYVLWNGMVSFNCQIEYRLLAHFSGDPTLCDLFRAGKDFHAYVGSQLFNVPMDELTKEQRSVGKKFNFAQLYGAGEAALAEQCRLSLPKVRRLQEAYHKKFPAVDRFKRDTEFKCKHHGGIQNPFGRWRTLPYDLAYRAVNTLIQSTAADIFKISIVRIHKFLQGKKTKILFPVHDELVFNYYYSDGCIFPELSRLMTEFNKDGKSMFRVPLDTEVSICRKNWKEKEELNLTDILQSDLDKRVEDGKPKPAIMPDLPEYLSCT